MHSLAFPATSEVPPLYISRNTQVLPHHFSHLATACSEGSIAGCESVHQVVDIPCLVIKTAKVMCVTPLACMLFAHMYLDMTCRSPAHCIEYTHLIQWGRDRPNEEFDADVEEHMKWMYEHALARAQEFGIQASKVM